MWNKATNLLAATLLIAAILLAIAAGRSASHADAIVLNCPRGSFALLTSRGVLHVVATELPIWNLRTCSIHLDELPTAQLLEDRDEMVAAADWQMGYAVTRPANTVERHGWGFSIGKGTDSSTMPGRWYVFASAPVWAVILLLLVLPQRVTFTRFQKWRRGQRGQCSACGYDLRESPGRCPECGFTGPVQA